MVALSQKESTRTPQSHGYHSYEETLAFLGLLEENYPEIVKCEIIGFSCQGKPIWTVRISANSRKNPAVLFVSLLHGIEVTGLEVLLALMEKLANSYRRDTYVTNLLNTREAWFIPVANPDGFGLSRRNARKVNLNRNFSVGAGKNPFSEPETRAIRDFISSRRFVIAVSLHSSTFLPTMRGNWIGFPYAYTRKKPEDYDVFVSIAKEMRQRQPYEKYGIHQIGRHYGYPLKGTLEDELYKNYGILPFLLEISNGGFNILKPSTWFNYFSWFNPENISYHVENNIGAMLYLLETIKVLQPAFPEEMVTQKAVA